MYQLGQGGEPEPVCGLVADRTRQLPTKHGPWSTFGTPQDAIDAVVRSANRTLLLVSGGGKADDETMLDKARPSMAAGATGLLFGRNVWQRDPCT